MWRLKPTTSARVESVKGRFFRQLTDFRKSCGVGNREQELVNGVWSVNGRRRSEARGRHLMSVRQNDRIVEAAFGLN